MSVYSPDPYVSVQVIGTPNGQKRTLHVAGSTDPEWNEKMIFYVDSSRDRLIGKKITVKNIFLILINANFAAEFVLFDLNRTVNEEIGREIFDIKGFKEELDHQIVISYKNVRLCLYNN